MAVKTFGAAYFAARYFRPVWFAESDESHLLPEEIRQEYRGNGRASRQESRTQDDADLVAQVVDKWETIERARQADAVRAPVAEINPQVNATSFVVPPAKEFAPVTIGLPQTYQSVANLPALPGVAHDQAATIARRRREEDSLILLLLEA